MTTQTYHCKVTNYVIIYRINNETAIMDTIYTDYQLMHALLNLIRSSHDDLLDKGIKKIHQRVTKKDYKDFIKSKTKWNIVEEDKLTQSLVLECDIKDMLQNMAIGLGIQS